MSIISAATNGEQVALVIWSPDRSRELHLPVYVALVRFDLADWTRVMVSLQREPLGGDKGYELLDVRLANYRNRGPRSGFFKARAALQAHLDTTLSGVVTVAHGVNVMPERANFDALFLGQAVAA